MRIAANLSMDTLKAVYAERRWFREGEVTPWPPEVFWEERHWAGADWAVDRGDPRPLSAELVLRAGRDRALIDQPTHALLVSVYCTS